MMLWYNQLTTELRTREPELDEEGWKQVEDDFVPSVSLDKLKQQALNGFIQSAAKAYEEGFWSEASGKKLFYDSTIDNQILFEGLYMRAQETDWDTTERYPGICAAGQAPVRAREEIGGTKRVYSHNKNQLIQLGRDLEKHIFKVKAKHWSLQEKVAAANTADELSFIKWEG